MTLLYGKCEGGPYHGKSLAHGRTPVEIAIDTTSALPLAGQVGPSAKYPYIRWYRYLWQEERSVWKWDDSR